jgi:hypothetical protein
VRYQKESDDNYLFLKHSQVCCVGTYVPPQHILSIWEEK